MRMTDDMPNDDIQDALDLMYNAGIIHKEEGRDYQLTGKGMDCLAVLISLWESDY